MPAPAALPLRLSIPPQAIAEGIQGVRRLEQRHISVEEAKRSKEVFLVGSSLPLMPVVQVRRAVGGCR